MKQFTLASLVQYLEKYYWQKELAEILEVDPRYLRLIKEHKRTGEKYRTDLETLYEQTRRAVRKPEKRRRPRRKVPTLAYVPSQDVLDVLFTIFEPRTYKVPRSVSWQHRATRMFTHDAEWPRRVVFNTWDSFFIVFGLLAESDPRTKKYRRVYLEEEYEDDEEIITTRVRDEDVPDTLETYLQNFYDLSESQKKLISHLPVEEWISSAIGATQSGDMQGLCNFWISRVRTADSRPEQALRLMESIAQDSVDIANDNDESVQFVLLGVYGFYGWRADKKGE